MSGVSPRCPGDWAQGIEEDMHEFEAKAALIMTLFIFLASGCGGPSTATSAARPAPDTASSERTTPHVEFVADPTIDFSRELEEFDRRDFTRSTDIDNAWFPLTPGTQYIYEGSTEESGITTVHLVIFTVTDMTKVIDGVRTLVIWDQDYSEGELVETELAFFAQDNDGTVWHFGQYPEVYERGRLVEAPAWISGLKGATAGISMKAEPHIGDASYSQGWGPAVNWTDRAQAAGMEPEVCVPADCYEQVLLIEEFSQEEPGAFQLKYYARTVGNIRVGWRGADATREILELVEVVELSPEALAEVRSSALELESQAYQISKEVYDQTPPMEQLLASQ